MRKINYISPTSYGLWKKSKDEYYVRYLMEKRVDREPQNEHMAIGACFDAYVKSYLFEKLYGRKDEFLLEYLFEKQVEPAQRGKIWDHGKYLFEQYKSTGALADLLGEMNRGSGARFEFDLSGLVSCVVSSNEIKSVPLFGKPDVSFVTSEGVHLILDFKVNGYFSKYSISPAPGYVRLRGPGGVNLGQHKKSFLGMYGGILCNIGDTLDQTKKDWAEQLSFYSWMTGEPVGSEDFLVGIEQVVCNNIKGGTLPGIRVAEHRCRINGEYQKKLFEDVWECWDSIEQGWIFKEMSMEDSKSRCEMLDQMYSGEIGRDDFLKELLG